MFTIDALTTDARFLPLLSQHLKRTVSQYDEFQQILRFLDSQEKWLLAFMTYRQWLEPRDGLTDGRVYTSQIISEAREICDYSRNTVTAFLDGLATYGIIKKSTDARDRRFQEIRMTEQVHQAFMFWYMNHGYTLDQLDGGNRAARLKEDPSLLARLHPPLVSRLIAERGWRDAPIEIDTFFQVKNGYFVLDYLMGMLQVTDRSPEAYRVGVISRLDLADMFTVGRSTIYRLFDQLSQRGFIFWTKAQAGPELWFTQSFVTAFCRWQAEKFVRVDHAFQIIT